MQIAGTSGSYQGGGLADLLNLLQSQAAGATGQYTPSGSSSATAAAANTSAPPTGAAQTGSTASTQFSTETLAALLQAQQPQTDPATSIANQLITDLGGGTSGSLSLSQVETALTGSSGASSANTAVAAEFAKLDTNGDGQLSSSELASGLQALQQAQQSSGGHHHHHHHVEASSSDAGAAASTASASPTTATPGASTTTTASATTTAAATATPGVSTTA